MRGGGKGGRGEGVRIAGWEFDEGVKGMDFMGVCMIYDGRNGSGSVS